MKAQHFPDDTLLVSPGNNLNSQFTTLYNYFYPALCSFALRLVKELPVAEDIVTEIFIKLWQRYAGFTSASSVKAFLYISTRNACLNHITREKFHTRVRSNIRYLLPESDCNIMPEDEREKLLEKVQALVEKLSPKCGHIIKLKFNSGITNGDIASQLKLSVNTVRNQHVHGIKIMRRRLGVA